MRSLREIKKSISHARVDSKPKANQAVLRHLIGELTTVAGDAPRLTNLQVRARILQATAAAAIVVLAIVIIARPPQRITSPSAQNRIYSAADLLTVGGLNAAYRRGGLEAVDRQCEAAARRLEDRPQRVSINQLLGELKGI